MTKLASLKNMRGGRGAKWKSVISAWKTVGWEVHS